MWPIDYNLLVDLHFTNTNANRKAFQFTRELFNKIDPIAKHYLETCRWAGH